MSQALSMIQKYASRGIIIDTNILLLYFVGELNQERIARFKRTRQFTVIDYERLCEFLENFSRIVTTPNILTEVSNLIHQLGEPDRSTCYALLANKVEVLHESYVQSQNVASTDWMFLEYGLTDCGIAKLAKQSYLVLTDDLKATSCFLSQGVDVLNFNHLREA